MLLVNCGSHADYQNFVVTNLPLYSLPLSINFKVTSFHLDRESMALAGNETPSVTSHRQHKKRICSCVVKGITNCKCDHWF